MLVGELILFKMWSKQSLRKNNILSKKKKSHCKDSVESLFPAWEGKQGRRCSGIERGGDYKSRGEKAHGGGASKSQRTWGTLKGHWLLS